MFDKPPMRKKDDIDFVSHPYIRANTIRKKTFQIDIASRSLNRNTAVILPTGLGKTIIAFLVMAEILPQKILFLAPTKPLTLQHVESCKKFIALDESDIVMITGSVSPRKRKVLVERGTIVVATPQTVQHDLKHRLYTLRSFGLIIFDEMHKAVERYAYVDIAQHFSGLILGLTASPGSKKKKIQQVFKNLKILHVETRVREDSDVRHHVKDIYIEWMRVPLSRPLEIIRKPLMNLFEEKLGKLKRLGILTYKKSEYVSKKDILDARAMIKKRYGRKPYAFAAYTHQAVLLQAYHCLELLETQGVQPFLLYMEKFKHKTTLIKSEKLFLNHPNLQKAQALAEQHKSISHPKLKKLKEIVNHQFIEEPDSLVLIFAQYRSTIDSIEESLQSIKECRTHRFIGQSTQYSGRGMTQDEQRTIIDRFRRGDINVLIATSVAEEGIDIPHVNRVIFYEPIPSEIRSIQRKGRTGRSHIGNVTILIAEGTRDEAFLYTEKVKEQKMQNIVRHLKTINITNKEDSKHT
jgi:ERCC4-related helicase